MYINSQKTSVSGAELESRGELSFSWNELQRVKRAVGVSVQVREKMRESVEQRAKEEE